MYRKSTLANGVRLVTEKLDSRLVSVGVWVDTGGRDGGDQEAGCAHFVEHMLFKSTRNRSTLDLAREFDLLGGSANGFTTQEATCFHATVLSEKLPRLVEILGDMLANSLFAEEEVTREREVILQEISMVEDTPEELAHELMNHAIWPDHPVGRPVLGDVATVSRMDRQTLLRFRDREYTPERLVITAAGAVDHDRFVRLWEPLLAGFSAASARKESRRTPPDPLVPGVFHHEKKLEQAHLVMGFPGLPAGSPDRYALYLLHVMLGGNMSSHLYQEVREQRGLAYTVYSFLNSLSDCGAVGCYLAVEPGSAQESLKVVEAVLDRFASRKAGERELANAKEYACATILLAEENMESRMMRLGRNELVFGREVPLDEVLEKIRATGSDAVQEVASRIFGDGKVVVTLGSGLALD